MGLFNKLLGKVNYTETKSDPEQAVIVRFNYGIKGLHHLHELETKLENVITAGNLGEYDGHEIAIDYSDGILYMYGRNAEILFKVVKSTLDSYDFMKGASVKLRFGPPEDGVKEIEFTL